jgi:phosphate transport system permease protein
LDLCIPIIPILHYSHIPRNFRDERSEYLHINKSGVTEIQSDSMALLAVKDTGEKNSVGKRGLQARRRVLQSLVFGFFRLSAAINGMALLLIVYFLVTRGWRAITWTFLTQPPMESMTKGGILPCIVGTICLSVGAILVAFPIGVASAIYLHEYARPGRVLRIIRLGINNLAGVPSVVFGLFGLAFFVVWLNFGVSILAGSLTLGAMTLPVVIGASEEALRSVPDTYREASLGLGATKWQTIYRVVLPAALPGILTGAILGVSRAAGETAPIMFTAAVFFTPSLPTSIFDEIMALPYHIYVLATAGTEIEVTRPLQYGTALVLITLVLGLNLIAIIYRARLRRRMR